MSGHKQILYMYARTSLELEVNMIETYPFMPVTFTGEHWYL